MRSNQLIPTEAQEASVLVAWLRLQGLKFHHSPNETGSSMEARRRAIRVKREGTSAGFPDYLVLIPPERSRDGVGYMFFVELKRRKGGRVSPEQRDWIEAINGLGSLLHVALVCNGADEAIDVIGSQLAGRGAKVEEF